MSNQKDKYTGMRETWDCISEAYADKFMHMTLYDHSYDEFIALLGEDEPKVLEVGCGPGNISRYLLEKVPYMRLLATDLSSEMIKIAAANCPSGSFKVCDARNIRSIGMGFSGIVSGFLVPYLDEKDCFNYLKDTFEMLLPGGMHYLSFVPGDYEQSGWQAGSTGNSLFFHYYELDGLIAKLREIGYDIAASSIIHYERATATEIHQVIILKVPE